MKNRNDSRLLKVIRPLAAPMPLARRMIRHANWAGALTGKFCAQTDLRAWQPQEFVYGLHSWKRLFFLSSLQQFQSEQRHSHVVGPVINNFFRQLIPASPPPALAKSTAVEHFGKRENVQQEQTLSPVLLRQEKRLPIERTFSRSARRPDGPLNTSAALSFHEAILVRRRMLREVAGVDGAGSEVAAGIVRRARRVEDRPPSQSLEPVFAAPATRLSRGAVEISKPQSTRESSAGNSFEALQAMPPAQFNITQLTDEVMRQIDRRLVGARERMGKI